MSTTIGENIKYFMYKYNVTMSDWYNSFSYIDKKIDVYANRKVDMNVKYTAHQRRRKRGGEEGRRPPPI